MHIAAVVLNYNRAQDTLACVESVRADVDAVIVVDNDSSDAAGLRDGLPEDVTFVSSDRNRGYAGGNNLGIHRALDLDAEFVLVLNNDLTVQPGCVVALTAAMREHPDWGAAGPLSLLRSDPSVVDFFTARVDLEHMALQAAHRDRAASEVPLGDHLTDYVTGSAMLLRASALAKIGVFDERFFLVWEDVDLCLRLRRAGFACGVRSEARVLHERSATFGADGSPLHLYFFTRNSFLMARKHLAGFRRWKTEALTARRYVGWSRASTSGGSAIRRGMRDGILGRFGPRSV